MLLRLARRRVQCHGPIHVWPIAIDSFFRVPMTELDSFQHAVLSMSVPANSVDATVQQIVTLPDRGYHDFQALQASCVFLCQEWAKEVANMSQVDEICVAAATVLASRVKVQPALFSRFLDCALLLKDLQMSQRW